MWIHVVITGSLPCGDIDDDMASESGLGGWKKIARRNESAVRRTAPRCL